MGNQLVCSNRPKGRKRTLCPIALKYKESFTNFELQCLTLIYKDVASRSNGVLTRETFTEFFNIIGLWGEKIFNKFLRQQEDCISFEEFLTGLHYYIKCPEEMRVKHLFRLYDLQDLKGISKPDFLQMLQNFPKEELRKILDDQLFLEEQQILHAYDNKVKRKPKKGSKDFLEQSLMAIRKSSSQQQPSEKRIDFESSNRKAPDFDDSAVSQRPSFDMMFPSESMVNVNGVPLQGFGVSFTFVVNGMKIDMVANLNLLIKKYVECVFKVKENKLLSLEEFSLFLKHHPKLINTLYSGFNYEYWGVDGNTQIPLYRNMAHDANGELWRVSMKHKGTLKQRYCELYPQFMMEFRRQGDMTPTKIMCMSGLSMVDRVNIQEQKYGFDIYHVEKGYKVKQYQCADEKQYQRWAQALAIYVNGEINQTYSILQKLGQGRFSIVYKCCHKQSKLEYALKIIDKINLTQEEKHLLSHETEIMKLLNHPCIAKLEQTIIGRTNIYIVTELIKDGDLFDYVQKKVYLDEAEAALILSQLIDAISYIHSIGIVHRDIKPENIMVVLKDNAVSQIKIIDFGFANYLEVIKSKKGDDVLCGTPNYLAPEAIMQKEITQKIDNFALGAILYLLLSGYLPFDSPLPNEIIQNTLEGSYQLEDEFWQCVSDDAKDLLRKLLKVNPEERISLDDAKQHVWLKKRKRTLKLKV